MDESSTNATMRIGALLPAVGTLTSITIAGLGKHLAALALGAIMAVGLLPSARAADGEWTGAGNRNWNSAGNWVGGTIAGNWNNVLFSNSVVNGAVNNDTTLGYNNVTVANGCPSNIVINGNVFSTTVGATITVTGADLTFNSNVQFFNAGAVTGAVAAGRTLTCNGTIYPYPGHINGFTKTGAGTLTLAGASTYRGNTTITEGSLVLAAGAGLTFVVTDSTNHKITGSGSATLNGSFTIDTSAVTTGSGTWILVDVVSKSFGATFTIAGTGWSGNSGVWTKSDGTKIWTFTQTTGALSVQPPQSEYVEVTGVAAGAFNPKMWENNTLNLVPDQRFPFLSPLAGTWRNIYAPSAVETPAGYRLFYGGWDGIPTGNDRIYSLTTDFNFQTFSNRHTVIAPLPNYQHANNCNALRLDDGSYAMFGTIYQVPAASGLNKPGFFRSDATGTNWNGTIGEPRSVITADIVNITGYNYANADINGMNAMLVEDGVYRLYFGDINNFIGVFRATSTDGKNYTYDGQVLDNSGGFPIVNDVKTFLVGTTNYYLMGLHQNGSRLSFALSTNGLSFQTRNTLLTPLTAEDRYMVALGWVVSGLQSAPGRRLLGVLYGAGPYTTLMENTIYARWLQKRVVFVADSGVRYAGTTSRGPDCQLLSIPANPVAGRFEIYAEDGVSLIGISKPMIIQRGQSFQVNAIPMLDAPVVKVAAEATVNQTAVGVVKAQSDGSPVFSITGGEDAGLFSIANVDSTGVLSFLAAPTVPGAKYHVEVTVADPRGSAKVLIEVTAVSGRTTNGTIFMFTQ